jgi:hypothetical protein
MAQNTKNNKTWQNFKRLVAAKYHDLKEQQKVSTSQTNFHWANAAWDITKDLDNLALAATTEHQHQTHTQTWYAYIHEHHLITSHHTSWWMQAIQSERMGS